MEKPIGYKMSELDRANSLLKSHENGHISRETLEYVSSCTRFSGFFDDI